MASSSSSHQQNQIFNAFSGIEPDGKRRKVSESSTLFDVFINHRGPDVKHGLATQLYNYLQEVGIRAFLDSEEKELGESFLSTIQTAIKSAKVHIAIFSKTYAKSAWCLAELVLMSQTKAKIIPVFYQVKPSDLRFIEKGEYAKYFTEFENKGRYLEKLPEWKETLQSLSFVAGDEFNGDYKNIIAAVQKEVQKKTSLHVATFPVGLDNLVEDFQRRCLNDLVRDFENQCGLEEGKYKSKVVGIFGMGGCGKTTLAKELFNRKSSNYCRASFFFDVREAHVTGRLPSLQAKLLRDLFQNQYLSPTSTEEGMGYLKDYLIRSSDVSFLIVVDDVDHVEQLNVLMINDILNKFSKTLIIITTRDVGVLIRAGITDGYNLKGMDKKNGTELFSWHAFNQPHPSNGYEMLVDAFVDVCGGLPLSLQVLGRHVHGKPYSFWSSALIQTRKTLPQDVKHRLKISFDSLSCDEKQIFMDIACFFIGKRKCIAERVWEGSGWNAQHSLEMLKDKCLVEETENLGLRMHDHLRDLGREMASELSTPRRLWRPQDLQYLESTDLKNILAKIDLRCFHSIYDKSMYCNVTFFLGQPDICVERTASVLWLELDGTQALEFQDVPSWLSLQYVQFIKIQYGLLKTLWDNHIQAPSQLKELQIYFCVKLEKINLAHLSCLKEITIEHCYRLKSVLGINNLTKLAQLNICQCPELEELSLGHLSCLESITIEECRHLKAVSGDLIKLVQLNIRECPEFEELRLAHLICLEKLSIEKCSQLGSVSGISDLIKLVQLSISECPELDELRLEHLSCLESITIEYCSHLKAVSGISDLIKLVQLNIRKCPELEELSFGHLSCLESITIEHCSHLKAVSGDLIKLVQLNIRECPELEELRLEHLICLEKLSIEKCSQFGSVSGISDVIKLVQLNIRECPELDELRLEHLSCLESITIEYCSHLKAVSGISDLIKLVQLNIRKCPELEDLSFGHLSCLESITIEHCSHLKAVSGDLIKLVQLNIRECPELEELRLEHLICLEKLSIEKCSQLGSVSGISDLIKLVQLNIRECPELDELRLEHLSCLESITIEYCSHLKAVSGISDLIKLVQLNIRECPELEELINCQSSKTVSGSLESAELRVRNCTELEELPRFSSLSCMEKISIASCRKLKLQNIILQISLTSLSVKNCSDLQRVSTTGDLTMLTKFYIEDCPELVELPNFSSLGCMKYINIASCGKLKTTVLPKRLFLKEIVIDSSEKLQNMADIDELHVEKYMRLCYCSNTVIRNCMDKLKNVPWHGVVIGRAVDGAESILNEYLFSGADTVTGIIKFDAKDIEDRNTYNEKWEGLTAILCCLIEVDSSAFLEDINNCLSYYGVSFDISLRTGEWIITVIGHSDLRLISWILKRHGIMKKGFQIGLRKDEEWKIMHILHRIVDRLHHL